MRRVPLSTQNAGMTRLRRKGNASPATLYECLNAYITVAGTIKPRPGTIVDTVLPAGTKGLVAHRGQLHVFSHEPVVMTDDRYVCVTLRHPSDPDLALREIHFAAPFMGYLYVVASFEDGSQWHYWAEELDAWEADTAYDVGARIFPTVANGYAYRATRLDAPSPVWQPSVERDVADVVEPTAYNGFKYTVVAVAGANPASGTVEPVWPTEEGSTVTEGTFGAGSTSTPPVAGSDPDPGDAVSGGRYTNPGGPIPGQRLPTRPQ